MKLLVVPIALACSFAPLARAADSVKKLPPGEIDHVREELGVNEFTAPSIEQVLRELEALKPFSFDKVWRDLPDGAPPDRARLALSTGAVIADGFLAVTAEKQSRIEPVGRVLLRLAKGLGVGDKITSHSRSILEKAAKQKWSDVRTELVRTQAEVEAAMLGLKDEELAHLVALGGWLRGLEMTSTIIEDNYSPERARRLVQPEITDYFLDRAKTLNPVFKKTKLGAALETSLAEIKRITTKIAGEPITADDAKHVRNLARELNKMIASGSDE